MKLRVSDVTVIKQRLRICGCNLFAEVKARGITTGEELPKDINENLLNADSISNKKHLSFVTERLVKGRKGLFELIAKLLIALGIKSKKKLFEGNISNNGRQTFIVILGYEVDLSKALKYPIPSIPSSKGNPDGTLWEQSPKNTFRKFLIDQRSAIETQPHFQARWIIDTWSS